MSSSSSMTKSGVERSRSTPLMKLPTLPWPISTTWSLRVVGRIGSRAASASASSFASGFSRLAKITSRAANSSGLMRMVMMAPARMRSRPCSGRSFRLKPSPARMKENSPIWAREAAMISAVAEEWS